MVMVPVPVPTFEKLWFRFRFLLLKSYGSDSGSASQKVKVPTVPVPQRWIFLSELCQFVVVENLCALFCMFFKTKLEEVKAQSNLQTNAAYRSAFYCAS